MPKVEIEFVCSGSSALFGNFATGDRLHCAADAARHFVDDAHCAKYVQTPAANMQQAAVPTAPLAKSTRARRAPGA